MPQSLVKNYIHIVFSTKNRLPLIDQEIESALHGYIAGICNNLDCQAIKIGGFVDHVHILFILSKNITLTKLISDIKSSSSKWIKTNGDRYKNFYWQDGYGAFSVSGSQLEKVTEYIINQKIHHTQLSYKDELRTFLENFEIEFDEKYMWD